MADLWTAHRQRSLDAALPLAVRMRPRSLDEFVGQGHVIGPEGLLRKMLAADRLTSLVFWGPPGTGKTALAELIAQTTGRHVEGVHAAAAGVKELREILDAARERLERDGRRTLLIVDEIHRFARNQQDVLLADVERGVITLVGMTTENPSFALRGALVSRSTVLRFEPLTEPDIEALLRRAIADERGFGPLRVEVADAAIAHWARISDGDARKALTALEIAVLSQAPGSAGSAGTPVAIDLAAAEASIQAKALSYDPTGDEHYDTASALIKSMRGSDPDASVYWLARMLESGEDPRFIARRIAILASEDIGNADPQAIQVAEAAWALTERLGLPECKYALAQAAIYMAAAPKSNASAKAIWAAAEDVRQGRSVMVPRHLRNVRDPSAGAEGAAGQKYQYPHDSADGYVSQDYLGVDRVYYVPTERGDEARIGQRLQRLRGRAGTRSDDQAATPGGGAAP